MDLEFRYLRDFLAVIESGSLGDAARRLNTSQPTLTRSVKLLERAVGGAVFDRTPRGMRPTALGRALLEHARVIDGDLGRAQRALDELVEGRRGKIVIGAGPLFGAFILPRAVARFHAIYPSVDIAIVQGKMRDILDRVKTGEIDCSFHSAPTNLHPELSHRLLLRGQTAVVVTRPDNPLAAKRRLSLKDLANEPWMLPLRPDYFRERFERLFVRAGLEPPQPAVEYTSIVGAPRFLFEQSRLLGVFFRELVVPELKSKRLVRLNVADLGIKSDSTVIFRRGAALLPTTAKFVEAVRAACEELKKR